VSRQAQRGLSSGTLLVVMVLAGSLLAYAVSLSTSAHTGVAQEIATARVLRAAQAGLAWGRFGITRTTSPSCSASTTLTVPWSSGAVAVTVRCTEALPAFDEDGTPVRVFALTATACHPAPSGACPDGSAATDYVQRQVSGLAQR
jgi:hypothetical protein